LNNNEIRREILKLLYKNFTGGKSYVEGANIIESIPCDKLDTYANLRYLDDKGLVNVIWRTGGYPVANINSSGIDLLEDESEFNRKFPASVTYDSSIKINNVKGDVFGVGVSGNENIFGKEISGTINIKKQILDNLSDNYSEAFEKFIQNLNEQIKKNNLTPEKVNLIQQAVTDLTKETEGISPGKEPTTLKKEAWRGKFFEVLRRVLPVLPKAAETIAAFTPLAPFSKIIGDTVEKVIKKVQEEE
jgi:hypothetical protein